MIPAVTVRGLLEARPESVGLSIELLAGAAGLDRQITSPYIQKTGLALAGFHQYLQPGRILLFGDSEIRYLEDLDTAARRDALGKCFASPRLPCLLITGGTQVAPEIAVEGERAGVPVLRTTVPTAAAIGKLTAMLEDRLAHREIIHGVLVDILGLGVLIVGESGIGKSECALDLVVRGHRLVADDTVEVRRRSESIVIGSSPEITRHHMEVRGLGLINIRDLFGVAASRTSKRVELVVQLDRWDPDREYDRLGLEDSWYQLIGLKVPLIRMPVAPGRNLAILVEVAARNQLLRMRGINAARELVARLDASLAERAAHDSRLARDASSSARTSSELRRDLAEASYGADLGSTEDEEPA
jgi:HPr kinase/phosphorylase